MCVPKTSSLNSSLKRYISMVEVTSEEYTQVGSDGEVYTRKKGIITQLCLKRPTNWFTAPSPQVETLHSFYLRGIFS